MNWTTSSVVSRSTILLSRKQSLEEILRASGTLSIGCRPRSHSSCGRWHDSCIRNAHGADNTVVNSSTRSTRSTGSTHGVQCRRKTFSSVSMATVSSEVGTTYRGMLGSQKGSLDSIQLPNYSGKEHRNLITERTRSISMNQSKKSLMPRPEILQVGNIRNLRTLDLFNEQTVGERIFFQQRGSSKIPNGYLTRPFSSLSTHCGHGRSDCTLLQSTSNSIFSLQCRLYHPSRQLKKRDGEEQISNISVKSVDLDEDKKKSSPKASIASATLSNDNEQPIKSSNNPIQTPIHPSTSPPTNQPISFPNNQSNQSLISHLPPTLQPYARLSRLDKPIGTYLLLHPCLWSLTLATTPLGSFPSQSSLSLILLFSTGSFLMRGAGCTINDMWDANFDKNVERTKDRPLASGELNYNQAWMYLALQLTGGLGVLVSLPHLQECFVWGVMSLPLVATYPLAKRWTNYPQLILGMTFNWGAIMGWVAVRGDVDWSVVGPLYASGVFWTLVYDTLYAHQDKRDDAKLGLKSTALTFGEDGTKPILYGLTGLTWGGWMTAGYNVGFGWPCWENPYYYAGVSAAALHLLWQVKSADLNDGDNLAYRFRSNNLVGLMVFGSCAVGNMMGG